MTHDDIKEMVESTASVSAPTTGRLMSRARMLLEANETLRLAMEDQAKAAAWSRYVLEAVTRPGYEMPDDPDTSPVQIDDSRSMFSSVGGGVILPDGYREKSKSRPYRVAASAPDSGWVAADVAGELIAMSVHEAFRRGLREVELPKT